jgi:hypothetical protein
MADTYSKLLGLSDSPPQRIEAEKPKPETKQQHQEDKTSLLANQQTSKLVKKQPSKKSQLQLSPPPSQTQHGDTSFLTTKEKTKYGTYLTAESIEKIRIRAIQTRRDDHQVLQEAVNQYFERLEK